jgi:L,D-peptidoglycan transpeptidase YkuD (ErfK/YbiS/YcfS/YnhG family)
MYVCDLGTNWTLRNWRFPMPWHRLTQNRQNRIRQSAVVRVLTLTDRASAGFVRFGNLQFPAATGKAGIRAVKREGDGGTPRGMWSVVEAYYRPDRLKRPRARLRLLPLHPGLGWCDAPGDHNYNRPVQLPYRASAEILWREDSLYDIILVLDYNISRRAAGRGSAIFVHAASPEFSPTAGCIALKRSHLLRLLAALPRDAIFAAGKALPCAQRARRGF